MTLSLHQGDLSMLSGGSTLQFFIYYKQVETIIYKETKYRYTTLTEEDLHVTTIQRGSIDELL